MIFILLSIVLWLPILDTGQPAQVQPSYIDTGSADMNCTVGQSTHIAWRLYDPGEVVATLQLERTDGTEQTYRQTLTLADSGFASSHFFPDQQTRVTGVSWQSTLPAELQMAQCNYAEWPPQWIRNNYRIPTSMQDCHTNMLRPYYTYMYSEGCPVLTE